MIVLAREIGADWVLMDEKKGRRKLAPLDMPKLGTLGILLKAKQLGLLPTIQPEIARLRRQGFSISCQFSPGMGPPVLRLRNRRL